MEPKSDLQKHLRIIFFARDVNPKMLRFNHTKPFSYRRLWDSHSVPQVFQVANIPRVSSSQFMTLFLDWNHSDGLGYHQLPLISYKVLVAEHDTLQFKTGSCKLFLLCSSQQYFEMSILIIWFEKNKSGGFPMQKWQLSSDFLMSNCSHYLLYHIINIFEAI